MKLVRRFPFGQEPARPRVETAPVPERTTLPLVESGAPPRPVLPFRAAVMRSPPPVPEAPPKPPSGEVHASARLPSRARRWLRIAFIVLGLLAYAAVLLGIVAPESWWR